MNSDSKSISGVIPQNSHEDEDEYFYQLGTIYVPNDSSSLKVTFNPSLDDGEDGYPDLVLISPEGVWYDYEMFDFDEEKGYETDEEGNHYYTGYSSAPEIMEIFDPIHGTWKVGVYPQYDIGDVPYTLEANFGIVELAGEIIERPNEFSEYNDVIISFTEDEEWRLSIGEILYNFGDGEEGVIPPEAWDKTTPGQIVIYGAPPFEFIITVQADGYPDKNFTINEGVPKF